ncbi:hypothetical protein G5714_024579 [Onychostoma macrolepis]|uniref:Uncharacterized protein n=1 Tax=Onychostoma macrolepis TaxID=369639 RepID=A0A7J6BHS1_9TELE|nr:hypothetical protein G5714_024579 [Onychostoma macrolepis]
MDGAGRRAHTRPSAARKSMVTEMRLGSGRAARWRGSLGAGRGPSPSDGGLARGRCEAVAAPPRRVRFFLESGCLGMQPKVGEVSGWGPYGLPEDSTRRVRSARSVRVDPFGGDRRPAVSSAAVGALLPRRCARPARFGQEGSGEGGSQPPGHELYRAPTLRLCRLPGVVGSVLAPSLLPTGEGRGPSLPVCASTGADCPQSVSDRAAPSGRGSGPRKGCSRSAAVGHPPDPS